MITSSITVWARWRWWGRLPLDSWTLRTSSCSPLAFSLEHRAVLFVPLGSGALGRDRLLCCAPQHAGSNAGVPASILLLASPLLGRTVFVLRGAPTLDAPFAIAMARRQRSPALRIGRPRAAIAFGRGRIWAASRLPLTGSWIACSIAGAAFGTNSYLSKLESESDLLMAFVTTFALALLLAILPISSACACNGADDRAFYR